ncbi:MAG: hypothetical protein MMC33_009462 [Icmadophila ericetorum]|nr:hypothetical protein [Icmadophila ericetorum]
MDQDQEPLQELVGNGLIPFDRLRTPDGGAIRAGIQKSPAARRVVNDVLLDALERRPESDLLQTDARVKENQLHHPDHARQAAVVIARLLPRLGGRLHAEHGAEAEQLGAVPMASAFVADQRHREDRHGISQRRPVLLDCALDGRFPRLFLGSRELDAAFRGPLVVGGGGGGEAAAAVGHPVAVRQELPPVAELGLAVGILEQRKRGVHLVLLQAPRVFLDARPSRPRNHRRFVALEAVNDVGFGFGIRLYGGSIVIEPLEEVCHSRIQAIGASVRGFGRSADNKIPDEARVDVKGLQRARPPEGLDGLKTLREAQQARQALNTIYKLQTSNCLGWHGHLLRGQQIIASKELDESLE